MSLDRKIEGCVRYGTGILATGMDVVPNLPNLPKCPVPVLTSYRPYRSVRCRYWRCIELTEVFCTGTKVCTGTAGTGIDVVPNLPKFPVRVLMSYRPSRSVRCRYSRCTELTKVSGTGAKVCTGTAGTGIDVVPNLPKFPVRVLMSYRTSRSFRYRY